MVRVTGLEPACRKALDPKSSASANFATPATGVLYINMAGPAGFEPTMTESKSVALPLGDGPTFYLDFTRMGRPRGIEPPSVGTTNRCVNHFATTAILCASIIIPTYFVL